MNPFNMEMCKMFIEANIPLKKVAHPSVVHFFETFTKNTMPCETTLRQKYVPILYENSSMMRKKVEDKYIWVSIDESTDVQQRMVVNFVFGIMDSNANNSERGKCFLLNMGLVDSANASNMAAFFNDSLLILWPNGKYFEKIMCAF